MTRNQFSSAALHHRRENRFCQVLTGKLGFICFTFQSRPARNVPAPPLFWGTKDVLKALVSLLDDFSEIFGGFVF